MSGKSPNAKLTDAERVRKRRRREKENPQHVSLDVSCTTISRLIADGYLAEADAGDRRAVECALEELLSDPFE